MGARRERIWPVTSQQRRDRAPVSGRAEGETPPKASIDQGRRVARVAAAATVVQRGILQAEEKYLVDPAATLGVWFARVQETVAVASRVTLARIEESRGIAADEVAGELLGVHADICAESIRAAARVWGGDPSPHARAEILELVSGRQLTTLPLSWTTLLASLTCCSAALEPLARGLRETDLPMGAPTNFAIVADCFLEVAEHAFEAVHVLC